MTSPMGLAEEDLGRHPIGAALEADGAAGDDDSGGGLGVMGMRRVQPLQLTTVAFLLSGAGMVEECTGISQNGEQKPNTSAGLAALTVKGTFFADQQIYKCTTPVYSGATGL